MATKSSILQIDDFSGGLVTKGSVIKLEPKQSPKLMNVFSTAFGPLLKRLGFTNLNTNNEAAVCRGIFGYLKDASNSYLMGYWGSTLKKMDDGATGWDATWDSLTFDTAMSAATMHFDTFKKAGSGTLLVTTESRDLMQSYDGTTVDTVWTAPKAKYVKVWANHVWAANVEAFTQLDSCDEVWNADTLTLHSCDATFDSPDTDTVASVATIDYKQGTGCNKWVVAAGMAAGDFVATDTFASTDLSTYDYVSFWIKCSVACTGADDLIFMIDEAAACASPDEQLSVGTLTAGTWTQVHLTFASAAATRDATISVGFEMNVDLGPCTIWVDDIRASKRQYITNSCDNDDYKTGDNSNIVLVNATHGTGLIAAKQTVAQIDLTNYTTVTLLAKSSYNSSGDTDSGLKLCLDASTDASSATCNEEITIPKMAANTWVYHELTLANPTTDTGINSVGIKIATDKAAQTIHIDDVRVSFTEPDRLVRSRLNFYDDWTGTDSGYEDIFTTDDIGLTATNELAGKFYIFKKKSIHRITYLGGRPLLDVKQVKSKVGTISPRTITNVDIPGSGEALIFLGSNRQLYEFDGYNITPISEAIQTSNGESDVYMNNITSTTGVNAALGMCHAISVPDFHWYVLFAPQGASATAPTHAIVYDYLAKAFYTFSAQAFTASWYGSDGDTDGTTDIPFVGKADHVFKWWNGTSDDTAAIAGYWESAKLQLSTKGRPMLKKVRYVEGSSKVNSTYELTFGYRKDWDSSYTSAPVVSQAANAWTREISQVANLIQVKVSDSTTTAGFEVYALDLVGEEKAIGR